MAPGDSSCAFPSFSAVIMGENDGTCDASSSAPGDSSCAFPSFSAVMVGENDGTCDPSSLPSPSAIFSAVMDPSSSSTLTVTRRVRFCVDDELVRS